MADKNIKIVKVDPSGFFVKKDEDTKESIISHISDESSVSSVSSVSSGGSDKSESHLNPLPNVSPNVAVIKEDIKEPISNVVNISTPLEAAQANNYLSTNAPAPMMNEVKVSNLPFKNDTREPTDETTEDTNSSKTGSDTTSDSESRDTDSTDDEEVIDMTDNTLYTVLAAVLEDEDGNNVSENLASINRHLEKHNETLEKIMNEYAEINRERGREKKYFEQMAQAINNQNRVLEKMASVFEVFLRQSGMKTEKPSRPERETIKEEEEEDTVDGGISKQERKEKKISRRIETPENTLRHSSTKIKVSKL